MAHHPRTCSVQGCVSQVLARGWCDMHYTRWRTRGDVMEHVPPQGRAGSQNRPKSGTTVLCVECKRMLPFDAFPPRRSRCHDCFPLHRQRIANARRRPCIDCGAMVSRTSKRCKPCAARASRKPPGPRRRYINSHGYAQLPGHHDHPNANSRGTVAEHTFVMSRMLGRPLLPGENVHHKNGVRDDNRPENLELWITSQPSGQRPQDLVAWARQIIDRYQDMENTA